MELFSYRFFCTRNFLTFVNTTAIAYGQKIDQSLRILVHAIAAVFTNVRKLRVLVGLGYAYRQRRVVWS